MSSATSAWTTSSPVWTWPSNPQWFIVTSRRSEIGTGQPGRHDTARISAASGSPIGSTEASNCGSDVGGADSTTDDADPATRAATTPQAAIHAVKRAFIFITRILSADVTT